MINYANGNMFENKHDCYVNTINCFGAMGAGIALEFKNRSPEMFDHYQDMCRQHLIAPGDCWRYNDPVWGSMAMLAVKYHWRNRIRVSWAKMAVRNFANDLRSGRIAAKNIALPRIGSVNGGRGQKFALANDNWADESERGYQEFEPFLLKELNSITDRNFTIYKFPTPAVLSSAS